MTQADRFRKASGTEIETPVPGFQTEHAYSSLLPTKFHKVTILKKMWLKDGVLYIQACNYVVYNIFVTIFP